MTIDQASKLNHDGLKIPTVFATELGSGLSQHDRLTLEQTIGLLNVLNVFVLVHGHRDTVFVNLAPGFNGGGGALDDVLINLV